MDTNTNCNSSFHIANIQSLITKTVSGENIPFLKAQEKISFLREQCKEETPYFLAFAETNLNESIKEAEFQLDGYSHETSHRKNRDGGGVIIYTNNNLTYQTLVTASDEICSIVGIYINELRLIVFMVYRPPPNYRNKYHGEILEKSFESIVISNIYNVINEYKSQIPDIILAGDFNFPKATWSSGIGRSYADTRSSARSLQKLIDLASELNLLQMVREGTRDTRKGNRNILELIFTNNHELISNIYIEPSKITDHKYITCETSYKLSISDTKHISENDTNLSSYNYETANWKNIKASLKERNWSEILTNHSSSEEKLRVFLEIVVKIIEENCTMFRRQGGSQLNNIPRDRRILLRKKKKLNLKLQTNNL